MPRTRAPRAGARSARPHCIYGRDSAASSETTSGRPPAPGPPARRPARPAARRGGKAQTEIKEVGGDFLVKSIPARRVCGRSLVKCRHRAGARTL